MMDTDLVEVSDEIFRGHENLLSNRKALKKPQKLTDEENKENDIRSELQRNEICKVDDFVLVALVYNDNTKKNSHKIFYCKNSFHTT